MAVPPTDRAVGTPSPAKNGRRVTGIGVSVLFLLLAFGAYYVFHVQRETAYYTARNLRILATVATQIGDRHSDEVNRSDADIRPVEIVAEPVFRQSVLEAFDMTLIADGAGRLRWHKPRGSCTLTTLDELIEVKRLGKESRLRAQDLTRRGNVARVQLDGTEYNLFTQPLNLVAGAGQPARTWIVGGLVPRDRFTAESVAISYTLLIAVLAALLLALLTVPFLKLALLGALQRVRVSDVLLIGLSLIGGTALMTIILLDVFAYRRVRAVSDVQLRRLASDIKRHARDEISRAYGALTYLEAVLHTNDPSGPVPALLRRHPAVQRYPFLESVARIDRRGVQVQKWVMGDPLPKVNVSDREYFRAARDGRTWRNEMNGEYVVEAIRSKTTGETQAVIAKPAHPASRNAQNAVMSMAIPMLSLIKPVVAGACDFAIIDDTGRVIFHSEWQRNDAENFFVETDHNKALRAAVIGRQNEMVNLRYWGDDQRAFVTPVEGTPWTLVTFRSKRLLRTLNVETIFITLLFLLIYALAYTLVAAVVAVIMPRYRAPWVWPDRNRGYDYRRLIYAYFAFTASFLASIYLLRPRPLMVIAFVLPGVVVLLTYLRLRRVRGPLSVLAAVAAMLLTAVWWFHAANGAAETDVVLPHTLVRLFMFGAGALGVISVVLPPLQIIETRQGDPMRHLLRPTYSYTAMASLLLAVAAVLPTLALYKAAFKIELESFVKHGQMVLVQKIEERLQAPNAAMARTNLGVYYGFFLNTEVYRPPTIDDVQRYVKKRDVERRVREATEWRLARWFREWNEQPALVQVGMRAVPATDLLATITDGASTRDWLRDPVPRFIEAMLPQYSPHSIRMRELLHSESADSRWLWRRRGDYLDFESRSIHGLSLVTSSSVPRLLPRLEFVQRPNERLPLRSVIRRDYPDWRDVAWENDPVARAVRFAVMGFAGFLYVFLLLYAIRFIARKIFLVDLHEPLWLDERARLGPALGGNLLIFAKEPAEALGRIDVTQFVEVKLQSFDVKDPAAAWRSELGRVDQEPPGKGILIPDFAHRAGDPDFTDLKLRLLESALRVHTRNVVAVTTLSPWVLIDEVSPSAQMLTRWQAVLSCFTVRFDGPVAPALSFRKIYNPEEAVIPTLKRTWRKLKHKMQRLLSKHHLQSYWAFLRSPRVMFQAGMTTGRIVVSRPIGSAVRRLAFSELMNGSDEHAKALLFRETSVGGDFLRQLGDELTARGVRGEEELYDEISERASAYYASLWAACTKEEKIVLMHVASDGFANEKDRHTLRRLLSRHLVRRQPHFRVMNETFRRFVISDPRRQEVAAFDAEIPLSAWDRVQKPLVVTLVGVAIFFFVTQRELFDASLTVISGLAGGIPALIRIVGFVVEPRSGLTAGVAAVATK